MKILLYKKGTRHLPSINYQLKIDFEYNLIYKLAYSTLANFTLASLYIRSIDLGLLPIHRCVGDIQGRKRNNVVCCVGRVEIQIEI